METVKQKVVVHQQNVQYYKPGIDKVHQSWCSYTSYHHMHKATTFHSLAV